MRWLKTILRKLVFPAPALLALFVPLAAVLLLYAFGAERPQPAVVYASYAFSAYTLAAVCVRIPRLVRRCRELAHRNRWVHRFLTDVSFRTEVSLLVSLALNAGYAAWNLYSGIHRHSPWFGAISGYYVVLALMRFPLLWNRKMPGGKEGIPSGKVNDAKRLSELRKYRTCGLSLLLLNQALMVIVILMVRESRSYAYPGLTIYAVAAYTFYAVTSAAVSLVKYRKFGSPVLSAAKAIQLSAALVSLLTLETAMLSQFGSDASGAFRQIMVTATGAGVCAVVLGIAGFMTVHATREIRRLRQPLGRSPEKP